MSSSKKLSLVIMKTIDDLKKNINERMKNILGLRCTLVVLDTLLLKNLLIYNKIYS